MAEKKVRPMSWYGWLVAFAILAGLVYRDWRADQRHATHPAAPCSRTCAAILRR